MFIWCQRYILVLFLSQRTVHLRSWIPTVSIPACFRAADPGGRQRPAVHHQGFQILQLLRGEDRPLGEVTERRVRNRGPDHDRAKKVDVPGVHIYGQRGHLQAAASRVCHLHGGTIYTWYKTIPDLGMKEESWSRLKF